MAEDQNASQAVENKDATQKENQDANKASDNQVTGLFTYYYSNPQSLLYQEHCIPIHTERALKGALPWRWHKEAPDKNMVDPMWDDSTNGWIDNASKTLVQTVTKLQRSTDQVLKQFKDVQDDHEASVKANAENDTKINTLQQMMTTQNAMMGEISGQLNQFGNAFTQVEAALNALQGAVAPKPKPAKPAVPQGTKPQTTQASQATQATKATEPAQSTPGSQASQATKPANNAQASKPAESTQPSQTSQATKPAQEAKPASDNNQASTPASEGGNN